jgi:hypothetical protein
VFASNIVVIKLLLTVTNGDEVSGPVARQKSRISFIGFLLRQIRTKSEADAAARILDELFPKGHTGAGEEA